MIGKLVRNRIPEIIEDEYGEAPEIHKCEEKGEVFRDYLKEKLIEEALEFREDPTYRELADVLEVINEIKKQFNIDDIALDAQRKAKGYQNGTFSAGYILISTPSIDQKLNTNN